MINNWKRAVALRMYLNGISYFFGFLNISMIVLVITYITADLYLSKDSFENWVMFGLFRF